MLPAVGLPVRCALIEVPVMLSVVHLVAGSPADGASSLSSQIEHTNRVMRVALHCI
jgi:hypothetical protein